MPDAITRYNPLWSGSGSRNRTFQVGNSLKRYRIQRILHESIVYLFATDGLIMQKVYFCAIKICGLL